MLLHLFIMVLITFAVTNKGDLYFLTRNESIDEGNTILFFAQVPSEIEGFFTYFGGTQQSLEAIMLRDSSLIIAPE
ncbi:MAG: hypothetical protein QW478_06915 [Candidatus Micrarchaeaceae archaeon]